MNITNQHFLAGEETYVGINGFLSDHSSFVFLPAFTLCSGMGRFPTLKPDKTSGDPCAKDLFLLLAVAVSSCGSLSLALCKLMAIAFCASVRSLGAAAIS